MVPLFRLSTTGALALLLAATSGCSRGETGRSKDDAGASLLSEVRRALHERDAKLGSYRFEGRAEEGEQEARYAFAFRSPNRMRGELKAPRARTLSFNGEQLFELLPSEKRHVTYLNKLPPEKSALFLSTTFNPFVPEGFRAPLLPDTGVRAKRVKHPKAGSVVELTIEARSAGDAVATVTYTLRPPAMDFLGKRTASAGNVTEVRVDGELCDEKLKLCVPTELSQWQAGLQRSVTHLSKVELNPTLPTAWFTLEEPEGFTHGQRELVESN